ncbi:glycerophosphodiester phosphodiesterase [Actinocatenispora comari]|uniref:Glycerophosphoryl diester phosphodiesterase n=1 Tax=Actinocatenispora comari TaxID=2807577 RepID=A0A8J4AGV7_9ACTN|nr:glycerophosphodiester phosphodiesterase [Actinocatenispora comari]GIL28997.1 glycerophosphoryl diester phosphodiesterase [Actinocatenispora comari]
MNSQQEPQTHSGRYPYLDAPSPLAFAHRGGAADGDENTAAAFQRSADLGYRYLETDVRATADGVPVIFHDADLTRLAGRNVALETLRLADLDTIRVGGEQAVPKLVDVLDAWPKLRFNLDVKSWPAVRPLVDAIRATGAVDRVLVASFSDRRLAAVRRALGPRLATSLGPSAIARLRAVSVAGRSMLGLTPGVPAAQVPVRMGPVRVVDRRFVTYAHRLGVQVHVWTIDDPDEMHRLLDLGVDGIMTDRIEVLREVLLARGQWDA